MLLVSKVVYLKEQHVGMRLVASADKCHGPAPGDVAAARRLPPMTFIAVKPFGIYVYNFSGLSITFRKG